MAQRTLKWSAAVAAVLVVASLAGGESKTAFGIGIGAAIALLSLWSLMFAVPRLVSSGRPGIRVLIGILYLLKLAVIAAVLWFAMTSPLIRPFAVFTGAAIVPIVIVGQRLKSALTMSSVVHRL